MPQKTLRLYHELYVNLCTLILTTEVEITTFSLCYDRSV